MLAASSFLLAALQDRRREHLKIPVDLNCDS